MSNKIVPVVYHSIIDEVIGSLKPDFDEFGVGDEVLNTLRQKWEQRIVASRAADFSEPQASLAYNPQDVRYNGVGSVATNPMGISRTNSPNINRTNSPASIVHSRAASRTNSMGASTQAAGGSYAQGSYSAAGSVANQGAGSVQVKAEPVERFVPGSSGTHVNQPYQQFNPMAHRMPPNGGVPGLGHLPPLPGLDAYAATRGHPGYANATAAGGAGGAGPSILMLPRHATTGYNSGAPTKMSQVDGTWDEEVDEETLHRRRDFMMKRYPWMAQAQMRSLDSLVLEDKIPQVDGPTPGATSPVPPLNTLPPLNLPSSLSSGISRTGGPPPLTLPPLNLPADLASGSRAMHPSLMNKNTTPKEEQDVKKEESDIKRPPSTAPGASSSFARNPNVPAQPSEDINSELDDTDEEEGPQEQPGSDPDADVTYCTYDKVTRVKTKWKVVFRDGMVHANGKDYLFGRCTGEFDW